MKAQIFTIVIAVYTMAVIAAVMKIMASAVIIAEILITIGIMKAIIMKATTAAGSLTILLELAIVAAVAMTCSCNPIVCGINKKFLKQKGLPRDIRTRGRPF